ncbi:hypothetical protein ACFW9F_07025 [Streptomyces sp. NPDC059506]|uniref:hypothetical protein n=1 Tax=Streptomyces sp. NPDC059506 TaxID=3347751 RepID=UPI00369B85D9
MTQAVPWQAPSDDERELYEAKTRGDWAAYFDVLARTDLFVANSRARADAHPGTTAFHPYWDHRTRSQCLAVFTAGMLPAPAEDVVHLANDLDWYARTWRQDDPPWLVVNPGSPCEAYFPTAPEHRAVWSRHAARAAGGRRAPRRRPPPGGGAPPPRPGRSRPPPPAAGGGGRPPPPPRAPAGRGAPGAPTPHPVRGRPAARTGGARPGVRGTAVRQER